MMVSTRGGIALPDKTVARERGDKLRVDHHVKSADGARYKISYVDSRSGFAELYPLSDDGKIASWERVSLPVAELTRIPASKRPAVEGMPDERPKCAWCDKKLRPLIDYFDRDGKPLWSHRGAARAVFTGWDAVERVFHANRCAIAFAGASYRGGYRRTK